MDAQSALLTKIDKQRGQPSKRSVALYLPVVAALDPPLRVEPELIDRLRVHSEAGRKYTGSGAHLG